MNYSIRLFCVLLFSGIWASAADTDLTSLKKELRILTQVLDTAFEREDGSTEDETALRPGGVESLYLANQGVVLTLDLNRGDMFRFHLAGFGKMHPSSWPRNFNFSGPEMDEEQHEAMLAGVEESFAQATEQLSELDFDFEGLSDETSKEVESLSKEKERLIKDAMKRQQAAMAELHKKSSLSEEEAANLRKNAESFKKEMETSMADMKARIGKLNEQQQREWNTSFNQFLDTFITTLCEYGASLRSLPSNEYLTVVFRGADRTQDEPRDLIYVYTKADLAACRGGQITAEQLKTKSKNYAY